MRKFLYWRKVWTWWHYEPLGLFLKWI